jgi:hypothetical protein
MEGRSCISTGWTRETFALLVGENNLDHLSYLQSIHDAGGDWSQKLREYAKRAELDGSVVDQYPPCYVPYAATLQPATV